MADRAELVARLASEVAMVSDPYDSLTKLCRAVCRVLGVDGGSVTLDNASDTRIVLCATDEVSATLESAQEVVGEGPCIDAYLSGTPVVTTREQASSRWPMFAELLQQTSASRIYALPMHAGPSIIGVIGLYQESVSELQHDVSDAAFLADALADSVIAEAGRAAVGEFHAWPDRRDIHFAVGMVIAQLSMGENDAIAILRSHAYSESTDLVTVARQVISRDLVFTASPEGSTTRSSDGASQETLGE